MNYFSKGKDYRLILEDGCVWVGTYAGTTDPEGGAYLIFNVEGERRAFTDSEIFRTEEI